MKPARIYYPWPSTLAALAVVAWQFMLANAALFTEHPLPESLRQQDKLLIAGAVLVLLIAFDVWCFLKARARCKEQLRQHQDQISELFDSKRELGTRARTYSDHADKLKMFISERLLEYIEYDEKFLHFKNIASEVRHNGVISYDKAQTALKHAQLTCDDGEDLQYREAADGLLYLWDLLDLSTTDNITLHVANQIYDCEEHYFQALLNDTGSESLPYQPTFMMSHALRRALLPITENPDQLGLNQQWPKRGSYSDEKFKILLQADSEMLGNENHMVLLIENLLNNALFYSQQKAYKNRHSSVSIRLAQRGGEVVFEVYNRGPRIDDDEKDKIYQLGFSSRRIREHHGKGLGLYFVNEITKGFEGSIVFNNIDNREYGISLSVKLISGEIHKEQLEIVDSNGKPMCQPAESGEQVSKRHEWSYSAPIASIEISPGAAKKPQLISGLEIGEDSSHADATDPFLPRWVLDVKNRKRSSKLVFMPLDVRGVEFVARFPTANQGWIIRTETPIISVMSDAIYWSACRIAREIRAGNLSSRDIVDACLERIEQVNPKINAVVQLAGERARNEADELDRQAARGQFKGPLHGVPITIKDSLDTEGIVTTGGTMGRKEFIPSRDAPVVARLRDAGAVLLGKTNTPELTFSAETNNLIYGRTNNPYDLERSPGGSSGGSAAVIACGGSALELGSDTGGSIREPAHLCGIAGIKPTSGRTPRSGHIVPYGGGILDSLTQIGSIARYVEDLALSLPLICGPDGQDPAVVPVVMRNPQDVDLSALRIAWYADNGIVSPHDDIQRVVVETAQALQHRGLNLKAQLLPETRHLVNLTTQLREATNAGYIMRLLKRHGTRERGRELDGYLTEEGIANANRVDPAMLEALDEARSRALGFFADYDAILCPPSFAIARPHQASHGDSFDEWGYIQIHNLLGWPGVSVRAGTSAEGLPVGVQLVAAPWREDIALALAREIEKLMGGFQPPPL